MPPLSPSFRSPDAVATPYGSFFIEVFSCGGTETLVLHTRDIPGRTEGVVCRIQSECVSHLFDSSCDCVEQISSSLSRINQAGGLLIYLRQDGMGLGLAATLDNDPRDCREYHVAVDILNHYSIRSVHLISLDKRKIESLEQAPCPIRVLGYSWHGGRIVTLGSQMTRTIRRIREQKAYSPLEHTKGRPRMLVLGDLNIDVNEEGLVTVGGSGYNAALALKRWNAAACSNENRVLEPVTPIIFGKVGDDDHGRQIRQSVEKEDIDSLLGIHKTNKTGYVKVIPAGDPLLRFQYRWEKKDNANDYDIDNLEQALELAAIGSSDYIFIASYLFVQKLYEETEIQRVIRRLSSTGANLIFDLVRKSVARDVLDDCGRLAGKQISNVDQEKLGRLLGSVRLYVVISDIGLYKVRGSVLVNRCRNLNISSA